MIKKKLTVAEILGAVFGVASAAMCFYSGVRSILRVIDTVAPKKEKEDNNV